MPMPIVLNCRAVSKAFDAHPLFTGLTLGIAQGGRVGLIGPNGSGKSTLLRILAGVEEADEGDRSVAQGLRLTYLPQRDEFAPDSTPTSVLVAAVEASHPAWEEHQRQAHAGVILGKTGFGAAGCPHSDQLVATLSGGWRKRLAIARALAQEPDLLLMDEPTNHLDLEGIWWLERLLADAPFTYVVVSHDRFFLERVCDRVVELNRIYPDGCFASDGGYSSFLGKRAEFVANQRRQQETLDNKVRREIEWLQRNPAAQTCKSKARVDQAGDLMADLAALKYRNAQTRRVDIDFTASGRRTNDLVVCDGVKKSLGGKPLFAEVELTLSPGTRLGVLGLNGSGKTTFLKLLTKQLAPDAGTVKHASELKVVVFDQKREQLDMRQSLRRALCPTGDTVVYRGRGIHIAAWAKRFLFSPQQLDLEVGKLSGGEQARILIANLMLREADLLLLDEPTNDLDIPSLEVLEESLLDFPGAVALVTHDRYLLDRVSTSLLALDGRGGAYRVADCAQWENLAARIQAGRNQELAAEVLPPPSRPKPATTGMSGKERRELERIGDKIQVAERKVADLEERIADPVIASDGLALEKACAELAAAHAEVERLYARWSELEARAQ
jgi:ATP-binding cassette subfamily F protein uup